MRFHLNFLRKNFKKRARYEKKMLISVLFSKLIVFCGHSKLTSSLLLVIIECDHKRLWLRSTTRKIILWALLRDFVCRVAKKTPGATLSKSILVFLFQLALIYRVVECRGPTRTPFSAIGILIQLLNVPNWRYDRFITDFCHHYWVRNSMHFLSIHFANSFWLHHYFILEL